MEQKKVFLVAEIGKNFIQTEEERPVEEYLENAKKLIWAAKLSGADAVKFQTHWLDDEQFPGKIISPHFKFSDRYRWVKRNTASAPFWFWLAIKDFCQTKNILFFSTPMSRGAAYILEKLDVPLWKIGSADILDFVMLDFIAQTGKPIIMSTGMSTFDEIDRAVNFLQKRGSRITLLHCVSKYPCSPEDLNLPRMNFLRKKYNLPVGFSDHSITIETAVRAVQMGAAVIEKHFSSSRDFWGSDHKSSVLPGEFQKMAEAIRRPNTTKQEIDFFGTTEMNKDEEVFRSVFRKTLAAGADLKKGEIIKKERIYAMRPQNKNGINSEDYEKVLGKKLKKDLIKYEAITFDVLE